MFADLRMGLNWLGSALIWRLIESALKVCTRLERRCGKLRKLGGGIVHR